MSFIYIHLKVKIVLFKQFSLAYGVFICIWPIDRDLLGATTQGQSEPGGDDNEGLLYIPPHSSIIGNSPSDC